MLFAGPSGAVAVGRAVGLVTGFHFLVEVVVDGLMEGHCAHGELADQLGPVVAGFGVKAAVRLRRVRDHVGDDIFAGFVSGPCGHRAVVELAFEVRAAGQVAHGRLQDVDAVFVCGCDDRKIRVAAVVVGQHLRFEFGRVGAAITLARQLLQAVMQDVTCDLTRVGRRIGHIALVTFQGHRERAVGVFGRESRRSKRNERGRCRTLFKSAQNHVILQDDSTKHIFGAQHINPTFLVKV